MIFESQEQKDETIANEVEDMVEKGLRKMQAILKVRKKYGILTDATVFGMIRRTKERKEKGERRW